MCRVSGRGHSFCAFWLWVFVLFCVRGACVWRLVFVWCVVLDLGLGWDSGVCLQLVGLVYVGSRCGAVVGPVLLGGLLFFRIKGLYSCAARGFTRLVLLMCCCHCCVLVEWIALCCPCGFAMVEPISCFFWAICFLGHWEFFLCPDLFWLLI